MSNCIYCRGALSKRGVFCPECGKQNFCSNCHEPVGTNQKFCAVCGTGTGGVAEANGTTSGHFNIFEFNETKTTRSARATLTDQAVEHLHETLSLVVSGYPLGGIPQRKLPSETGENGELFPPGSDANENAINITPKPLSSASKNTVDQLKRLFYQEGDNLVLEVQDLKAKGQKDFGIRLIYLRMLYAKEVNGQDFVLRDEINSTLKEVMGGLDPNVVSFITNSNDLFHKAEDGKNMMRLKGDGHARALEVLAEIADDQKSGTFILGSRLKVGGKSVAKGDETKSSSKGSKSSTKNKDVDAWISQWNALNLNIDLHGIAKDLGQLDRVTLALWVIHKATNGSVGATTTYKIAPLIEKLLFAPGNRGNLNTALKNGYAPKLQKTTDGWRITPEGIKHAQSLVDGFNVKAAKA